MNPETLRLLTSPDAGEVLEAALATVGDAASAWHVDAVHARPGAETSVAYAASTLRGDAYLIASDVALTAEERHAAGAVRLESPDAVLHVWQHPADPRLPGLATVCDPATLAARWHDVIGQGTQVASLELLVLRPLRRAVVRATMRGEGRDAEDANWFIKVVRPSHAEALLERHRRCPLAPQAHDLGEGIVALAQAQGVPLAHALYRPDGGTPATIDPAMLLDALASLPADARDLPRRRPVADRLDQYAATAVHQGLTAAAVAEVTRLVAPSLHDTGPLGVTHGDFHPANVFVDDAQDPRAVTALIDVDTLGPGRQVDDLAGMLAHLLVLPTLAPQGYPTAESVAQDCFAAFADVTDPVELRARTAANLLALAAGADAPGQGEAWLELALAVARGTILG